MLFSLQMGKQYSPRHHAQVLVMPYLRRLLLPQHSAASHIRLKTTSREKAGLVPGVFLVCTIEGLCTRVTQCPNHCTTHMRSAAARIAAQAGERGALSMDRRKAEIKKLDRDHWPQKT